MNWRSTPVESKFGDAMACHVISNAIDLIIENYLIGKNGLLSDLSSSLKYYSTHSQARSLKHIRTCVLYVSSFFSISICGYFLFSLSIVFTTL